MVGAGVDGAGADGAGADRADATDGDEGAAHDDHDTTAPSGRVRGVQSGPKRMVVPPSSDDEAELSDMLARPQKLAKTRVYTSSAKASGKAQASSWSEETKRSA